jgi:hypothetical protein
MHFAAKVRSRSSKIKVDHTQAETMARGSQLKRYDPSTHVAIYQTPEATECPIISFMRSVTALGNVRIQ